MGDIGDLKSPGRNAVRVQFPPPVPKGRTLSGYSFFISKMFDKVLLPQGRLFMQKQFRPNAAIIIINESKQVLLCERSFPGYVNNTVQTVQGGIDPGETPREAAEREIIEELGVAKEDFEIIDELEKTFSYEWPKEYLEESRARYPGNPYVGQEQHFLLAVVKENVTFDLDAHHREFDAVRWGTAHELVEGMWGPKRVGTEAALRAFGLLHAHSST